MYFTTLEHLKAGIKAEELLIEFQFVKNCVVGLQH